MNIIASVLQLTNLLWHYVLAFFFGVYIFFFFLHMYMFMYVLLCLMPHLPMCIQKHVCQFGYTYSIAYGGKCEIHPILLCHPHIACGHFRHFTSKGVFLIYWLYHYISSGIVFINDASWSTWCYFIICIYCILLYILCFIPWTGQELTSIKMIYIINISYLENFSKCVKSSYVFIKSKIFYRIIFCVTLISCFRQIFF